MELRIRIACVSSLISLALMAWSMVDSRPIAVIIAMSIGQALGTLSLALFLIVVIWDLRRARVLAPESERLPEPPRSERAAGSEPPAGS